MTTDRIPRTGSRVPSFDPVLVGTRERDAWAAYYRHEWCRFLVAAVAMVRAGFGMPWPATLKGAWLVLRANQAWAPFPDNDPAAAHELMRRFYALVARRQGLSIDPVEAAGREVEWWRVHRGLQQHDPQHQEAAEPGLLVAALARLCAYVYGVPEALVTQAARERTAAMELSDAWVAAGCDPQDARLAAERDHLVRSYGALRAAVAGRG